MKENKLGRKFANTWSPPRNRFATRMANKGVRKNAKLMIKAGEEASEGGRSNYHASVTSLLHGQVCNEESNLTVNQVSNDIVGANPTFLTKLKLKRGIKCIKLLNKKYNQSIQT